jgi:5-formyltetrahydrofolate cyclo-ligase
VESFGPDDLAAGPRGVREPRRRRPVEAADLDVVVVPGVAFDGAGARLGRGAGFYDRFLHALPARVWRVGVAFDLQILERVPTEGHDARLDLVVTETRTLPPVPPDPRAS